MGVRVARSMNQSLHEGATDGVVKKERPNTEVDAHDVSPPSRAALHDEYYDEGDASHVIPDLNAGHVRGA